MVLNGGGGGGVVATTTRTTSRDQWTIPHSACLDSLLTAHCMAPPLTRLAGSDAGVLFVGL